MTHLESRCLSWITMFIRVRGYAPTVGEIMAGLQLGTGDSVRRLLDALERQKKVTRERGKQRSIELVDEPRLIDVATPVLAAELKLRGYPVERIGL